MPPLRPFGSPMASAFPRATLRGSGSKKPPCPEISSISRNDFWNLLEFQGIYFDNRCDFTAGIFLSVGEDVSGITCFRPCLATSDQIQ